MNNRGSTKVIIIIVVALLVVLVGYLGFNWYQKVYGKSEYIPGIYSEADNIYQNDYFGIKCTLKKPWEVTKYVYDAEKVKSTLDSKQMVNELYAQNKQGIEVIAFFVQQTPYNVKESGKDINKMLDPLKDTFKSMMEQSGYNIENIERDSITIAGENCEGFKMTGTMQGSSTKMSLVQYYVFKGNYMGAYTASSTTVDKAKNALTKNFTTK